MPHDDRSEACPRERNERTRVLRIEELRGVSRRALDPRRAFLVAHERLAVLSSAATRPSIALVALGAQAEVLGSRLLSDGDALIIGRHSECGLSLDSPTVSLRHIAVLVRFDQGRPLIHLRDLATGIPFVTEDGRQNAAIVADGPLYAAIESYALWLVPVPASELETVRPEIAFAGLPARSFVDQRGPEPSIQPERVHPVTVAPPEGQPIRSAVTSLRAPLLLGDGDEPEVGWGELRIDDGQRRERRVVSAERLERGVLLGRYERCGLILSSVGKTISRVHALLLRIGTEVWVVDTASTNGTWRGATSIRAHLLQDVDVLTLSHRVTLDWRRTIRPEA